jgi:DNA-binding NarL/FixJ family response regulator
VRVADNGRGISEDVRLHGRPGHFGLRGMATHAQRIGATLRITSAPEAGHNGDAAGADPKDRLELLVAQAHLMRRKSLDPTKDEREGMVTVLIADDHPMVREGVAGLLTRHQISVVGLAATGRQALEMYMELRPAVMLLDLRLPDQSGFEVLRAVLKTDPEARILILTSAQGDASIYTAIHLGARGYLLKGIDGATLAAQVRHVAAGGRSLSEESVGKLTRYIAAEKLSEREIEVLGLVSQGKSNKEIADLLVVSEDTVKMHLKHIFRKLHANDRTQAVVIAIQQGLLEA